MSDQLRPSFLARLIASDGAWTLPLYTWAPGYPPAALAQHKEADVVLEFTITEFGRPRNVAVVSSSDSAFNDAAADALSNFLYAPRLENGVPVAENGVRTMIRFELR